MNGKEKVEHLRNGILLSHKEERSHVICRKMDGTGDHHVKRNKSELEKQKSLFLSYVEVTTAKTRQNKMTRKFRLGNGKGDGRRGERREGKRGWRDTTNA
jgi:hypothetical protein